MNDHHYLILTGMRVQRLREVMAMLTDILYATLPEDQYPAIGMLHDLILDWPEGLGRDYNNKG